MGTVSVVLPVYNEAENIEALVGQLGEVLERATRGQFEVVFVDDGSTDASPAMLDALAARSPRCKVIHFSRNFGHQAALQAGLDVAAGDAIITMDADLQDPPEVLARLIAKWREGYDVVYAIRRRRKDGLLKRAAYAAFYRSLRAVAEIDVPLDAGRLLPPRLPGGARARVAQGARPLSPRAPELGRVPPGRDRVRA